MKVFFIRHGESEYNVKNLVNQDPKVIVGLTKRGIKQAEEVAEKFKDEKFDVIFVSELERTKRTAEIINKSNIKVIADYRINEVMSKYEGESTKIPDELLRRSMGEKVKGVESVREIVKRVSKFLDDLKEEDYSNVLVVSHEAVLMAVFIIINGLSDKKFFDKRFGNCEILEIEI